MFKLIMRATIAARKEQEDTSVSPLPCHLSVKFQQR